jgi:hypothetical protein
MMIFSIILEDSVKYYAIFGDIMGMNVTIQILASQDPFVLQELW